MLVLERQSDTVSPLGEVLRSADLRMRVNGQVVDLPRGKVTIGSGPRCNLRIEQPGVHPLHCLIMHEAEGLSVRRWAGDIFLNGEPLEESALRAGDCLSVGPAELEVIGPTSAKPTVELPVALATNTDEADRLRAGRDRARTRSRQLLAALRRDRAAHREMKRSVADLQQLVERSVAERNSTAGEQQKALAELAAARQQAVDYQALVVARDQLVNQNQRLNREARELADRVSQLTREQAAAAAARQSLVEENAARVDERRRLIEENSQLRDQSERFTIESKALCGERDLLCQQNEEHEAVMHALAEENTELGNERTALLRERYELREQNERLQAGMHALGEEKSALGNERTFLLRERDELCQENERLQASTNALAEDKSVLGVERTALCDERDQLRQENERLEAVVAQLDEENTSMSAANAQVSEERDRLLQENQRFADLEHQMHEAVADRESTSGELYRALLQVAEMQARDDQHEALATAHQALNEQHEHLRSEMAELLEQIGVMNEERASADDAQAELAEEKAALSEARQLLASENAELVASLNEMRRQLEQAAQEETKTAARLQSAEGLRQQFAESQRKQGALEETVARLEQELIDKQQAESTAAATIAACERKIADHARQLAEAGESVQRFQEQLAVAEEVQSRFDGAREEWQRQRLSASRQEADQLRRIAELEAQLAAAAERAAAEPPQRVEAAAVFLGEVVATPAEAPPAEFEWSSGRSRSAVLDTHEQEVEEGASEIAAEVKTMAADGWAPVAPGARADESAESEDEIAQFGEFSIWNQAQRETPASTDEAAVAEHETADDFSAWKSDAEADGNAASVTSQFSRDESPFASHGVSSTLAEEQRSSESNTADSRNGEPTSFIERYSHMFAEDGAAQPEPLTPALEPPMAGERGAQMLRNLGVVRPAADTPTQGAPVGDEESIEDYMAKLLQRVRGETPRAPTSQWKPSAGASGGVPLRSESRPVQQPSPRSAALPPPTSALEPLPSSLSDATPQPNAHTSAGKRTASLPAPKTDLQALRALANETARRAISRHALRKLRRNAITKVIVSTLAGVTSLWLMLEAPDWRHLQFITACLALMVAAYWAGQTYRTLLESLRIAAHDGPEDELVDTVEPRALPLPIDVENRPALMSEQVAADEGLELRAEG